MKERLFDVMMGGPLGNTYELTLKYQDLEPVTLRTDNVNAVFDLVLEHVHYHYRNIVHEKIKNLLKEPAYIGFIDELVTPYGKVEFRSRKYHVVNYEIVVDDECERVSAYYHMALADYVKELYTLVNLNMSNQIRHLIEWLDYNGR